MSDSNSPPECGAGDQAACPPLVHADLAATASVPDDAGLTVNQVAAMLNCSPRHVWRMSDSGRIPRPFAVGQLRRWRAGSIRAHIRGAGR